MYNKNIDTIWHRKICIKIGMILKIFGSFGNFGVQTLLILPDQNVLTSLDQNVSFFGKQYVLICIFGHVGT